MQGAPDETNDPRARSWVSGADRADADFPLQNLPFAVFRRRGTAESFRGGVAIGDQIVDLAAVAHAGLFTGDAAEAARAASQASLEPLMALGPAHGRALRRALFSALREDGAQRAPFERLLVAQSLAQYALPARIGDFTDFYTSIHHATAVGRLFRPDQPLLPNYRWLPIGYHGRSSSIGLSGQTVPRPRGQRLPAGAAEPLLGPTERLDYELELGVFIGAGNEPGRPIPIDDADAHVFGLCLLNDWSARDLQAWEYQPLGPFLGKNFATTISPWIVPLQALAPFRVPLERPPGDPRPLAYLDSPRDHAAGAFDIRLETLLHSAAMQSRGEPPQRLAHTSFRHSYWTIGQMIAHHTVNGCNLRAGDLLGTGTQSGPAADEAGSLLELTQGGRRPIRLGSNETRAFLEDGDTVILRGWCERPGAVRIGLGEARGTVQPSLT